VEPRFLVADEPTSALDVSMQSQILKLIADLQARMKLTLLFISHDLSVIRYLCDEVAVMYLGKTVETGPAQQVLDWPRHPYTVALLTAIPRIDQRGVRERRVVAGELPSPFNQPTGCRFHPRCTFAQERCRREEPPLEDKGDGQRVACFYHIDRPPTAIQFQVDAGAIYSVELASLQEIPHCQAFWDPVPDALIGVAPYPGPLEDERVWVLPDCYQSTWRADGRKSSWYERKLLTLLNPNPEPVQVHLRYYLPGRNGARRKRWRSPASGWRPWRCGSAIHRCWTGAMARQSA
jgi:oligopeptide/dipeptide ABC transporter ATP-binding protein